MQALAPAGKKTRDGHHILYTLVLITRI